MKKVLLFIGLSLCINFLSAQTNWGIVGSSTPNGWIGPDLYMTHNLDTDVWEATVYLNSGEFKFRADDNWGLNYGDDGNDGSLEQNGANIPISEGTYKITLNLNTLEYTILPVLDLSGSWIMAPEEYSLFVGPYSDTSIVWWYNSAQTLIDRACYFDDKYVFNPDGTFVNVQGESTWLETWQNPSEACGTPLSPHDGSVIANYAIDEDLKTITLDGVGAYIGVPKANNSGQLPDVPVPTSITYDYEVVDYNTLQVSIVSGESVYWRFKLIRNSVYIQDENFEQALIDLEIDSDGVINHLVAKSDIEYITELNVNDRNIASLIGIEEFSNLQVLYCQRNQITSLNVSENLELTNLECENNLISELDLTQNSKLKIIGCASNNLSELDVSQNLSLEGIWCTTNNIQSLDLDVNKKLVLYGLTGNPLTSLSIKNGNNRNIIYSTMQNLPYLGCITVDDESVDNSKLNLDPNVSISNNCSGVVEILDPIFEQALIDLELDTDATLNNQISQTDAESIISLDISNLGINDLTGIKYFANIEQLNCSNNNLTKIDFGSLNSLIDVNCNDNAISSLNLNGLLNLDILYCQRNQLEYLDIANNTLLSILECETNLFSELDVSNNELLKVLGCSENNLSDIDVSNNLLLEALWVGSNNITGMNLDVNTKLNNYGIYDNPISYLSIRNGNNANVVYAQIHTLPELSCINVDDPNAEYFNTWRWTLDEEVELREDCGTVYIPDANFEQALLDIGVDKDNTINHLITRFDAEAVLDTLNLTNPIFDSQFGNSSIVNVTEKIADLTGIEAFINLTYLSVGYGELTSIDVSNSPNLSELWLGDNQLTSIDLSQNSELKNLGLMRNPNFGPLDVSNLSLLEELYVDGTSMTSIDVSNNTNLQRFFGRWSNLTGVDLSKNSNLTDVRVRGSANMTYLNVRNGNNSKVNGFDVREMPNLSCVTADGSAEPEVSSLMLGYSLGLLSEDCGTVYIPDSNFEQALIDFGIDSDGVVNQLILRSDVEFIESIDVSRRNIKSLVGLEAFIAMKDFYAYENRIESIDVSNLIELRHLSISNNNIVSLDLTSNIDLVELYFNNNQITNLVMGNHPNLINVHGGGNQIDNIDLTNSPSLQSLILWGNNLYEIDLNANINLTELVLDDNKLIEVDASSNSLLEFISIGNNELTSLNVANGNNINFVPPAWADYALYTLGNPNLACIQVDLDIVGNIPSNWQKDNVAIYSIDCNTKPEYVYIPDENFEQSLIDMDIDKDGAINTYIFRADAEAVLDSLNLTNPIYNPQFGNPKIVNVQGKIDDLSGIEAFTNITYLGAGFNNLTSIDVSNNTLLTELFVNDNQLSSIDITNNTELRRFGIMRNPISGIIDLGSNVLLEELYVHYTGITSIDLSNNANLWKVYINNNNLAELDISSNLSLQRLDAQYNSGLNLVADVNGHPSLTGLNLSGTDLNSYNIYAPLFPNVQWLLLNDNNLDKFNGNNALALTNLHIANNMIESLNLSANTGLVQLNAVNNILVDLDLRNGNNANLTSVQITDNLLTCISVDDSALVQPYDGWSVDPGVVYSDNCKGEPDVIIIPDSNFEQALINLGWDTNGDGQVNGNMLLSDALSVTELNLESYSISNLEGIQYFENLVNLNMNSVNYSGMLDLSINTSLEYLDCSNNNIDELNISDVKGLINLNASNSNLNSIDLSTNNSLVSINLSNNSLTELNIVSTRDLTDLFVSSNNLSNINLSGLTSLVNVDLSYNNLTKIDVKDLDQLNSFNLSNNQLVELDIRNGNNINISSFDATNNMLICIGVDDELAILSGWSKDVTTSYSSSGDCLPPTVVTVEDFAVQIDAKGLATISTSDIDNGSSDNVTIAKNLVFSFSDAEIISELNFNCTNIGESNPVYLTVTDLDGNSATAIANVIVEDNISPNVRAVRSFELDLNGGAGVSLDATFLDNGSDDNCGNLSFSSNIDYFSYPGTYPIEFYVTDQSGNMSQTLVDIEVIDSKISGAEISFGGLVLTAFPVPFSDVINVSFSKPTDASKFSVTLNTSLGIDTGIIFTVVDQVIISDDTNGLVPGVYELYISDGKKTKSTTILKE